MQTCLSPLPPHLKNISALLSAKQQLCSIIRICASIIGICGTSPSLTDLLSRMYGERGKSILLFHYLLECTPKRRHFFLSPPTTDVSERINEISVLPICMVLTTVYMPVFNTTLYALVHLCNVLVFLKPHPNDSEVAKIQPNIFGQHN